MIAALRPDVKNARRFVGHSMGAITTIVLAADYPELVGAIILENPRLRDAPMRPLPGGFLEARRQENEAIRAMLPEERTAWGAAQNPGWHPAEIESWVQSKVEVDPAILNQFGRLDKYSWREAFQRIRCPGLLIIGDPAQQAIVTPAAAREVLGLWPSGELAYIEGGALHPP